MAGKLAGESVESELVKEKMNGEQLEGKRMNGEQLEGNQMNGEQLAGTCPERENVAGSEESPVTQLWCFVGCAQAAQLNGDIPAAIAWFEKAREHTPTCLDVAVWESKLLSHEGAFSRGSELLARASAQDRGDRYLTNLSAKWLLKLNCVEEAEKTAGYWTKQGACIRVDLWNMEARWFLQRCGEAYMRRGDWVHANKLFVEATSVWMKYRRDAFDFHSYALRKGNVTEYRRVGDWREFHLVFGVFEAIA